MLKKVLADSVDLDISFAWKAFLLDTSITSDNLSVVKENKLRPETSSSATARGSAKKGENKQSEKIKSINPGLKDQTNTSLNNGSQGANTSSTANTSSNAGNTSVNSNSGGEQKTQRDKIEKQLTSNSGVGNDISALVEERMEYWKNQ
jgi:hypothetical protein